MAKEFVLVHGMSHGAWVWEPVRSRLEAGGHRVVAIDLPGHGRRAHERARASIDGYARAVADAMTLVGLYRAVVVGHSMAGAVIAKVAELVPTRVSRLVFLASIVPQSGSSLLATDFELPGRLMVQGLARSGCGTIQYPAAMVCERWMNDLAPGDPRATWALANLTPQPLRPWIERVDLSRFYAMDVPRTYVRCLGDIAVPPAKAAEYAARLGVVPIDLDCAHGVMLSQPDALVALLLRL